MLKDNGLEERVGILEQFVDNTQDVGWFRALIKDFLFELEYRFKDGREPISTFRQMKEDLREIVQEEDALMSRYNHLVFRAYDKNARIMYMAELAAEIRKIRGLPEDAEITLVDGSDEWNAASKIVHEREEEATEERKKTIDYETAFSTLLDITRIRVNIYAQVVKARGLIASVWDLAQQDYAASFTSGSRETQERLGKKLRELISYVDSFPGRVAELVQKYPKTEFLEIRKALPENIQKQLG